MPIAYWILNNEKYDPGYNPNEWEFVFRRNILNVPGESVKDFLAAVEVDAVDLDQLIAELKDSMEMKNKFFFFIDFDNELFVSSFPDIEVEDYLPNESWTGVFGNPTDYLPGHLQAIFAP